MDRARKAIPVSNHVTYERHRQKKYKKHRQIVTTTVKCKVDARLSGAAATKRTNVKREQILEERYYEIERNNLHLLKKMHAMYNEPHESQPSPNKRVIQNDARRLEQKRIADDNRRLAARIQNCKPTFTAMDLARHAKWHEKKMVNACHLPVVLDYVSEVKKGDGGRVLPGVSPRKAKGLPTSPLRRPTAPKTNNTSETSPNKARTTAQKPLSTHMKMSLYSDTKLFELLAGKRSSPRIRNVILSFLPHRSITALLILNEDWKHALCNDLSWLHARDIGQLEALQEEVGRIAEEDALAKANVAEITRVVAQSGDLVRRSAERVALQTTLCSEAMREYDGEVKLALRSVHALDPAGVAQLRDLEEPSAAVRSVMAVAFSTIVGPDMDASWSSMKQHLFPSSRVLKDCLGRVESGEYEMGDDARQIVGDPNFQAAALGSISAAMLVRTFVTKLARCHDIRCKLEPEWAKLDEFNEILNAAASEVKPLEDDLFQHEKAAKRVARKLLQNQRLCSRYARQLSHMDQPQNREDLAAWAEE